MTLASFYKMLHEHGAAFHLAHKVLPDGRCSCHPACPSPGKHPRSNGWQDSPGRPLKVVDKWLANEQNVSVAPHKRLFVIDVDPPAMPRLAELDLPPTATVATPRGGRHLYYTAPVDCDPPPNAAGTTGLGPGVDIRGEGGQVIGAGSVGVQGSYTIVDDRPIAEAPPELVARCRPADTNVTTPGTLGPVTEDELLTPVAEGQRNTELTRRVGKLVTEDLTKKQVLREARLMNALFHSPLDAKEVETIVRNVWKRDKDVAKHLKALHPAAVVRQHQYGHGPKATFSWELEDGSLVSMGDTPTRPLFTLAQSVLITHGYVVRDIAKRKWHKVRGALFSPEVTEVHPTQSEEEVTEDLALIWFDSGDPQYHFAPDGHREVLRDLPQLYKPVTIDRDGTGWFQLPVMLGFLHQHGHRDLSLQTLGNRLTAIGFRNEGRQYFDEGRGRARLWSTPPGFLVSRLESVQAQYARDQHLRAEREDPDYERKRDLEQWTEKQRAAETAARARRTQGKKGSES